VPGTARPDQLVLLGAHLDSWDLGEGAVDDAAGVGIVLDVAQRLAKSRPSRTVRVVLFANEENGLKGAFAYVEAHRDELPRHVVAIEVDAGGGVAMGVQFKGGPGAAAAMEGLGPRLAELGLPAPSAGEAGGADTSQLTGVPQVELVQDRARYFDVHHTADDTCDKIQPREAAQVAQVALLVTRYLTELETDLGRAPVEDRH
jgi:carboxypeptidase Q